MGTGWQSEFSLLSKFHSYAFFINKQILLQKNKNGLIKLISIGKISYHSTSTFHMNRTFNKGVRSKIAKKVSKFGDQTENFYLDTMFSTIVILQRNRALL